MSRKIKLKNKKETDAFKLFGKALDLPTGINELKVEINGNKRATVDGCRGVAEYYTSLVKLNIGCGTITFTGQNLHISSFDMGVVELTGRIENLEYCM